jgi:hypothetical protein
MDALPAATHAKMMTLTSIETNQSNYKAIIFL